VLPLHSKVLGGGSRCLFVRIARHLGVTLLSNTISELTAWIVVADADACLNQLASHKLRLRTDLKLRTTFLSKQVDAEIDVSCILYILPKTVLITT